MSKVVILGAGSSKGCGFPLGDEMLCAVLQILDDECRDFLEFLFPGITACGKCDSYVTFDRVFSAIDFYVKSNISFGGYSVRRLHGIQNKLFKQYIKILADFSLASSFDLEASLLERFKIVKDNYDKWYKPFFRKLICENKDISFISFNYDVLIDKVLSELSSEGVITDYNYGIDIYDIDKQKESMRKEGLLLLKPHGSLNIVECPICKKLFTSSRSLQKYYFRGEECITCGEAVTSLYKAPKVNKELYDHSLNDIRLRVVDLLSAASSIDVIGYALPNYDMNVLALLAEGRAKNPNWKSLELKIIDTDPKVVAKYESVFGVKVSKENTYFQGFKEYAVADLSEI